VQAQMGPSLSSASVSVDNANCGLGCGGNPGEEVRVSVSFTYNFQTPLIPLITGLFSGGAPPPTISMVAATSMRMQ
jgi:hypothetical protein